MKRKDASKFRSRFPRTDKLQLGYLRYFIVLAEELNFARASDRLGIDPSPLSRGITQLERLVGVKLLYRGPRGTQLTPEGTEFLKQAKHVLLAMEQAHHSVIDTTHGRSGSLRIGLSTAAAHPILTQVFTRFSTERPRIALRIHEMTAPDQIAALKMDTIDAGLGIAGHLREGIRYQRLWADYLVALLPVHHALADKKPADLREILAEPLVLHDVETSEDFRARVDSIIQSVAQAPRISGRVANFATLLSCVGAGLGIGVTTTGQANSLSSADLAVRPLTRHLTKLTVSLILRDEPPSALLDQFLDIARVVASGF